MQLADPKQILRSAKSILLVDWASRDVPLSLVQAGFEVFCASPGRYSVVELGEDNCIFFHQLEKNPAHVDIVNVFRPENEHEEIVARYVIPLGAKVLWLQPSIGSGTARRLGLEHGFELVEGVDIASAV